ncbi:MAG: GNAT family N-acetyltransferase [Microbacteriaceae bacterium]|nr:GNAT family N-acetyltransferase [Microbacteriaceae bacterium]
MSYPLFTERLSMGPLSSTDVDSFVHYRRDPVIARFQGWETTFSDGDARELLESQAGVSIPEKGQWLQLAIHDRVTGELVGDLALHSVVGEDTIFEIGFTIAKEHQGQGFATEAASRLMNHLFAEVGATKLVAKTDSRNTASIAVLVALGFVGNPSQSRTENFKNEDITMDHYETRG